jgi:quercetin dioxygenase-like cupin family protein
MTTVEHLPDVEGTPHANVFPGDEPRTIRLALEAGDGMEPHRHPDRTILFHVLEGAVELRLGGEPHELAAGDLARFDGDQEIAPVATEDATALVVLVPRPE